MSRHKTHLDPETGAPFYPLAHAQGAGAALRIAMERLADPKPLAHIRALEADVRVQFAKDALTAYRTPAGCAAPTIDDIPSCGQENDYRRARPTPAASEGPFNAEMPSSLNDACRRLDLAQERISQLEAQVEEASGLIHDLLGLELGSSERAMAWLDSRSDTSTSRAEPTPDAPHVREADHG